jgi:pimeloyl-[acyl-carrier protein] methyl ester esterase
MGGLVTLQALQDHAKHITGAVLVATNPSFVVRPHWPEGVDESLFIDFARQLKEDFHGTLHRFLVLETLGSEAARESLRQLRENLHAGPMPDVSALEAGLGILRNTDYTQQLGDIGHTTLWVAGGRDRLVPPASMQRAAAVMRGARFERIRGAGHAPFMGHRQAFARLVVEFLEAQK